MNRCKNILFVNEPKVDQASAIKRAVSLAKNNLARFSVINVIPRVQDENREQRMANYLQNLDSLVAPYRQHLEIDTSVIEGTIFLEAIRAVLRNGHDLVIKPAENPDFLKQLFGSNDMHLLRKCPCPVWLMKLPEKEKYDCILAAVDFNPLQMKPEEQDLNANILEMAGSLAVSEAAALHIIHSWEAYAETAMKFFGDVPESQIATHTDKQHMLHQKGVSRLWESVRERNRSFDSLPPHFHLPRGAAKQIIPRLADELQADLIVMGTIARTGIPGLFIGNTAETILNQISCSVIAIKPSTFKTPVKLEKQDYLTTKNP